MFLSNQRSFFCRMLFICPIHPPPSPLTKCMLTFPLPCNLLVYQRQREEKYQPTKFSFPRPNGTHPPSTDGILMETEKFSCGQFASKIRNSRTYLPTNCILQVSNPPHLVPCSVHSAFIPFFFFTYICFLKLFSLFFWLSSPFSFLPPYFSLILLCY